MRTPLALITGIFSAGLAFAQTSVPNDPLFLSKGTWGQDYADQWGLHRIGFDAGGAAAWTPSATAQPVTVAVIDTGIDYTHPDFARESLWTNPKETLNGIDDDRNGFIDDVVGWNFAEGNNNPWDRAGHGTLVSGLIAATSGNGLGIAGVNRYARIMPLEVLNVVGRGRSSHVAAAIHYAMANGARVINLSFGSENLSGLEERAIRAATDAGIIVIVAAGNLGRTTAGFGLADARGVIVVAATDPDDQRARFSNWGRAITIAAPGVDILGLRARDSDLVRTSGAGGTAHTSAAIVGTDGHYYRASGTSFAAGFVSGVASWLLAQRPELTGAQAARMILQSARDIGPAGVDPLTGYGLVDARAALAADPNFWIESRIEQVDLSVRDGETRVRVVGTSDAEKFSGARLRLAPQAFPNDWIDAGPALAAPIRGAQIAELDPRQLRGSRRWILQLVTQHENGRTRESRFLVDLGEPR